MKQLYSLLLIVLLAATSGRAASWVTPEDTIPGHKRAVQLVSKTLCTKLAREEQRSPLANLTQEQSKALFTELMLETMSEHSEALLPLFAKAGNTRSAGEALGRDVVLGLANECPVAVQFVMRMGLNEVKNKPAVSEKEKTVLALITTDICQRIEKHNVEKPLESRSKEERTNIISSAMQGSISAHMEELGLLYGAKNLQKKSVMEDVGTKIALLMAEQCSNYLLMLGVDNMKK